MLIIHNFMLLFCIFFKFFFAHAFYKNARGLIHYDIWALDHLIPGNTKGLETQFSPVSCNYLCLYLAHHMCSYASASFSYLEYEILYTFAKHTMNYWSYLISMEIVSIVLSVDYRRLQHLCSVPGNLQNVLIIFTVTLFYGQVVYMYLY
jgi:hypothetical protein